jgi:hypothetical protein
METFDHKAFYRLLPEIDRLSQEATAKLEQLHATLGKARDSSRSYVGMIRKFQSSSKKSKFAYSDASSDFRSIVAQLTKLSRRYESQREAVSNAIRELRRHSS